MVELICYVSLVNGSFFRSLFLPNVLFQPCDKEQEPAMDTLIDSTIRIGCANRFLYSNRLPHRQSIVWINNWSINLGSCIGIDYYNQFECMVESINVFSFSIAGSSFFLFFIIGMEEKVWEEEERKKEPFIRLTITKSLRRRGWTHWSILPSDDRFLYKL